MAPPRLILASASPRRQQLLREAGYDFVAQPSNLDEDEHPPGLLPGELAEYLAFQKAQTVARQFPDAVVLGADTLVTFGDMVLGKPESAGDARRMLELLSGTTHLVITGLAVVCQGAGLVRRCRVMSAVHMRPLTEEEIESYVAGKGWVGKAGGYGIQDNDPFVTRTSGSHTNIVGLPIAEAKRLLQQAGVSVPGM